MGSLQRSGQFLMHQINRGTDKKAGNTASGDQNILQSMRLCLCGESRLLEEQQNDENAFMHYGLSTYLVLRFAKI